MQGKIYVVGPVRVGKSELINQLNKFEFEFDTSYQPTEDIRAQAFQSIGIETLIYDVPQQHFKNKINDLKDNDVVIICFNYSGRDCLSDMQDQYNDIRLVNKNVHIIVVQTKNDINGELNANDFYTWINAQGSKLDYFSTSAKKEKNIDKLHEKIVTILDSKTKKLESNQYPDCLSKAEEGIVEAQKASNNFNPLNYRFLIDAFAIMRATTLLAAAIAVLALALYFAAPVVVLAVAGAAVGLGAVGTAGIAATLFYQERTKDDNDSTEKPTLKY